MFYSVNTLRYSHENAASLFSHVQNCFIEHVVYEVVLFKKSAETENLETSSNFSLARGKGEPAAPPEHPWERLHDPCVTPDRRREQDRSEFSQFSSQELPTGSSKTITSKGPKLGLSEGSLESGLITGEGRCSCALIFDISFQCLDHICFTVPTL